jgi:hypothetical protein
MDTSNERLVGLLQFDKGIPDLISNAMDVAKLYAEAGSTWAPMRRFYSPRKWAVSARGDFEGAFNTNDIFARSVDGKVIVKRNVKYGHTQALRTSICFPPHYGADNPWYLLADGAAFHSILEEVLRIVRKDIRPTVRGGERAVFAPVIKTLDIVSEYYRTNLISDKASDSWIGDNTEQSLAWGQDHCKRYNNCYIVAAYMSKNDNKLPPALLKKLDAVLVKKVLTTHITGRQWSMFSLAGIDPSHVDVVDVDGDLTNPSVMIRDYPRNVKEIFIAQARTLLLKCFGQFMERLDRVKRFSDSLNTINDVLSNHEGVEGEPVHAIPESIRKHFRSRVVNCAAQSFPDTAFSSLSVDIKVGPDVIETPKGYHGVNAAVYHLGVSFEALSSPTLTNISGAPLGHPENWVERAAINPHINGGSPAGGWVCLGGFAVQVAECLANYDLFGVAQVLTIFNKTVDTNDEYGSNVYRTNPRLWRHEPQTERSEIFGGDWIGEPIFVNKAPEGYYLKGKNTVSHADYVRCYATNKLIKRENAVRVPVYLSPEGARMNSLNVNKLVGDNLESARMLEVKREEAWKERRKRRMPLLISEAMQFEREVEKVADGLARHIKDGEISPEEAYSMLRRSQAKARDKAINNGIRLPRINLSERLRGV